MVELGGGDGGERVASLDAVMRIGSGAEFRSGNVNLFAYEDVIGIREMGIGGEEFVPALASAKVVLCELPEGVSRTDDYKDG
jgi:hypothetical protein